MLKRIYVLFLVALSVLSFNVTVFAYDFEQNEEITNTTENGLTIEVVEYDDLPDSVKQSIENEKNSNASINDHIEKYAYEVDLEGNITEVIPLEQREQLRIPNDGYTYILDGYDSARNVKDWTYKIVETVRYDNKTSYPISGSYAQQTTVTTSGYVEGNASASTKVNMFVSEVEVELGITAGFSRTWSKGSTYGVNFTVQPNSTIYVTNYAVGVDSNGSWRYARYSKAGAFIGYYYESAGGTVISKTDNNISVY